MEIYTPEEVAKKLRISRHTVYELIHLGKLRAIKIGRRYKITHNALEEFLKENEYKTKLRNWV